MLPYMTDNISKKGKSVDVFKGINTSAKRSDGEPVHSVNMSGRNYPAMAVRKGRSTQLTADVAINGAGVYNELFYTGADSSGDCRLYYGENSVSLGGSCEADAPRTFAAISDSILVLPDNKLYTPSDNSLTELVTEQSFTLDGALEKTRQECNYTGYELVYYVGNLYSDRIQSASFSWGGYQSYHLCPSGLSVGDVVHISMDVHPIEATQDKHYFEYQDAMKEGFFAKITAIDTVKHEIYSGEKITDITALHFDSGTIDMGGYDEVTIEGIVISQKVPELTNICTHGNRVWGTEGNSIRSSALGKAGVWYDFSADTYGTLPSSCYSAEVDSGGEFTAICSFNGSILAFKQNCIHKVYGTQPENYTLYTQSCTGVEPGGANTLAIINGELYYKGADGFYAYSGGVPVCISRNIELEGCKAVSSATDGTNYYTLMQKDGAPYLLVYYPQKGIWHTETIGDTLLLVGNSPDVYAVCGNSIVNLRDDASRESFDWSFEMSFDEDTYRYKYYSRVLVKYRLADNGYFTVTTRYDNNHHLSHISGNYEHTDKGYSIAQLPPVRCRDMRLVFRGNGDFELFDITREYRLLSDEK